MTSSFRSWLRVFPVALLLTGAGVLLYARTQVEIIPPRPNLSNFPGQIGNWVGGDLSISNDVLQVLGPGEFLSRIYQQSPGEAYVTLFVAYFSSQRTGDTIHSPKNCLPGSGWTPITSGRISLQGRAGEIIRINRYLIAKGPERQLVLYWYQAHGRVTPSEYWAKIYLVTDAVRMNRTDGALVRIVTPIAPGETTDAVQQIAVGFAQQILPTLSTYIPR